MNAQVWLKTGPFSEESIKFRNVESITYLQSSDSSSVRDIVFFFKPQKGIVSDAPTQWKCKETLIKKFEVTP